jgi:hypothetical protein
VKTIQKCGNNKTHILCVYFLNGLRKWFHYFFLFQKMEEATNLNQFVKEIKSVLIADKYLFFLVLNFYLDRKINVYIFDELYKMKMRG